MFLIKVKDFDFGKIFNSGLFYFFYGAGQERKIIAGKKIIKLRFKQIRNLLHIHCSDGAGAAAASEGAVGSAECALSENEKKLIRNRLRYCFGLDEDMSDFYSLCGRDRVLKKFLPLIKGTRIISAYSDFEALVGAIVSQNNSYMHYRRQMSALYKELNFRSENYLGNLEQFRLGYKSEYLQNLAAGYGKIPLAEIKGIGAYSLNLFEIFQKRNYGAFYIDCLTEKIMSKEYRVNSALDDASKKLWGEWRGLALAYLQRFFEQKPQNK